MSEENWITNVYDCLWYTIEQDSDLQVSGSGWRAGKGGGWNCKLDDERFPFREKMIATVGSLPMLAIVPDTSEGGWGASQTSEETLSVKYEGRILSKTIRIPLHYAYLIHRNIKRQLRGESGQGGAMFEWPNASPPLTNRINLFRVPALDLNDFAVDPKNWVWYLSIHVEFQCELRMDRDY